MKKLIKTTKILFSVLFVIGVSIFYAINHKYHPHVKGHAQH